jgi:Ca-activated chloride channel homolog
MKKVFAIAVLSFAIMACETQSVLIPKRATVNGYTFVNKDAGQVKLSVSALNDQDQVLPTGTISNASVSNLAVSGSRLTLQASSATVSVCANISVGASGALRCAIILDSTGSMKDNDPPAVPGDFTTTARNQAAKTFVNRMGTNNQAATASFDTGTPATNPYLALKVTQDFTANKTLLRSGIDAATKENTGTNLWNAVFDASDLLATQSSNNRIALILTDGKNTLNSGKTVQEAIANATSKGVKIYMIGLGSPSNLDSSEMESIARGTGGLYATTGQTAELNDLFNGVFNATQAQGCMEITFNPVPAPGTVVSGTLNFSVNGVALSTSFSITF